ncbi:hypothetical protein LSAT2_017528 [Lamellibrachia satsuma]|nr:hypothetical protein LSAT2_017528 [Lamellibrachia satsuma]
MSVTFTQSTKVIYNTTSPTVTLEYKYWDQAKYSIDLVPSIKFDGFPKESEKILRNSWIPRKEIDNICKMFHVVAKIHPTEHQMEPRQCRLWRFSFSAAEKAILYRADGVLAVGNKTCASRKTSVSHKTRVSHKTCVNQKTSVSHKTRVSHKTCVNQKTSVSHKTRVSHKTCVNQKTCVSHETPGIRKPRTRRTTCRKDVLRLLKMDLLEFYAPQQDTPQEFCSYHLKMLMFHLYDQIPDNVEWKTDNMLLLRYVDALNSWQQVLVKRQLPHYFLQGDNLLQEVGLIPKAGLQLRALHAHVSAILKKWYVCSPGTANINPSCR